MRLRLLVALLATGALLALLVPGVSAAPFADAEGAPDISIPSPTGYYLWHTDDGWHLRTHGPAAEHVFDAVLHTDGVFENVSAVRLEGEDSVAVLDGGRALVARFHTYDGEDGMNFTIRDASRLHLDLKLDGSPAMTSQIFLGNAARNPKQNPFTIKL